MGLNLKSAEEVKEYLENLYTEYKFGCCNEKRPEVCHLLGDYEEAINHDYKKSSEIYKNNCDEFSYGRSCAKYGGYKILGKGCAKNEGDAYEYMKKGCELGDSIGCANFGALCMVSDYKGPDKAERLKLGLMALRKSCFELNSERGCFTLGSVYLAGIPGHIEKNYGEAYRANLKSCEIGNPFACSNISQMHAKGEGAEKNQVLAKSFKERAVELYQQMEDSKKSIHFQQGTT